jgi:hypothetical protein
MLLTQNSGLRFNIEPAEPILIRPAPSGSRTHTSPALLIAGGAAGWAAGVLTGVAAGYALDSSAEDTFIPATNGMAVGGLVGGTIGAPLGVHLANRRRGNFLPAFLSSIGVQVLTVALARGLYQDDQIRAGDSVLLMLGPAVQVGTSVAIELARTR